MSNVLIFVFLTLFSISFLLFTTYLSTIKIQLYLSLHIKRPSNTSCLHLSGTYLLTDIPISRPLIYLTHSLSLSLSHILSYRLINFLPAKLLTYSSHKCTRTNTHITHIYTLPTYQCGQMVILFSNIWPLKTVKICPTA